MKEPFDIYGELTAAEQAAEKAALREARDGEAWRQVMNTAAGRRVIRSLLARLDPLSGSALDHASLAYREGQRCDALHIVHAVRTHAPEHFPTLFEEPSDE